MCPLFKTFNPKRSRWGRSWNNSRFRKWCCKGAVLSPLSLDGYKKVQSELKGALLCFLGFPFHVVSSIGLCACKWSAKGPWRELLSNTHLKVVDISQQLYWQAFKHIVCDKLRVSKWLTIHNRAGHCQCCICIAVSLQVKQKILNEVSFRSGGGLFLPAFILNMSWPQVQTECKAMHFPQDTLHLVNQIRRVLKAAAFPFPLVAMQMVISQPSDLGTEFKALYFKNEYLWRRHLGFSELQRFSLDVWTLGYLSNCIGARRSPGATLILTTKTFFKWQKPAPFELLSSLQTPPLRFVVLRCERYVDQLTGQAWRMSVWEKKAHPIR